MIFVESLYQGGMGAAVAALFGGIIGTLWVKYSLSSALGLVITFHFPWASIWTTIAIGIVVSAIAGVFPARRAARMEIAEAIHQE